MKNVLVTGGAGFIGSNFVRFLLQAENAIQVVNLDLLTYAGSMENLADLPDPGRHHFVHGDICDRGLLKDILHQYKVDTVVHFAAETHVDRSIIFPDVFWQTNVVGTCTLLEACRQYWLVENALAGDRVRFHHISTDEVFGALQPGEPAWTEETPYAPHSPYSASKAASDHFVRAYQATYELPCSITNCSNNYGPYQFPEKLVPLMIANAVAGKTLPIYGDGQQIRDWLYVGDHCEAIWLVLTKGKAGETYNIGGGSQPTNFSMVQQLCSALDELLSESSYAPYSKLIRFVADRPGHDRRYAINFNKIHQELGWHPRHSLGQGLHETIQWYLEHPEWMEKIRSQQDYQVWMKRNYLDREENKP
jgi:dTDP-glucose 4,6-dehydratase